MNYSFLSSLCTGPLPDQQTVKSIPASLLHLFGSWSDLETGTWEKDKETNKANKSRHETKVMWDISRWSAKGKSTSQQVHTCGIVFRKTTSYIFVYLSLQIDPFWTRPRTCVSLIYVSVEMGIVAANFCHKREFVIELSHADGGSEDIFVILAIMLGQAENNRLCVWSVLLYILGPWCHAWSLSLAFKRYICKDLIVHLLLSPWLYGNICL